MPLTGGGLGNRIDEDSLEKHWVMVTRVVVMAMVFEAGIEAWK